MNFIRESIFISSLRSFCSAFLGITGALLGLVIFFVLSLLISSFSNELPTPKYLFVNQPRVDGTLSNNPTAPTILRLNVEGMIGGEYLNADHWDSLLVQIDTQLPKNQLKGILVYFDTGGGSAIDSYRMYLQLKTLKERYNIPIYGFVEGMCASGGIYISAGCDKMFSSPPSILGSVGVRMGPFFNVSSLLKTYGVDAANISTKNKIHMDPYTPWSPNETDFFKPMIDEMYAQFVDSVVDGRCPQGMSKEDYKAKLLEVGANIFTSKAAVAFGFTDDPNATLTSTLEALVTAAEITDSNYRFVSAAFITPFKFGGMKSFFEKGTVTVEHKLHGDRQESMKHDQVLALYP